MVQRMMLAVATILAWQTPVAAQVIKQTWNSDSAYITAEALDDDLIHLEVAAKRWQPEGDRAIYTSPHIAKTDYNGPHESSLTATTMETSEIFISVRADSLCIDVSSKLFNKKLTEICPADLETPWKGVNIAPQGESYVYGLGQQFVKPGSSDGDWTAHGQRTPGDQFGNQMVSFNGGANGNTQFPVIYVLGKDNTSFALFFDNVYKQSWDFRSAPWKGRMWGDQIRFYIMSGPQLADLRKDYMELVGRPLIPPKKMFGLWVSEYGYENWREVDQTLAGLKSAGFPVDGFVLDLQWFGGVLENSDHSPMGRLDWDEVNFPSPDLKIKSLKDEHGIGLMLIEESYVSRGLAEHDDLHEQGFLVRKSDGRPAYLTGNPWWGKGGLIDWSNPSAGSYWHDWKRQPLVEMGIMGHWTDLGEPEMYDADNTRYHGVEAGKDRHADVHNLFSLLWHRSIYDGYQRNNVTQRPFIVSRSGAPGMQRYGAAMWSADIGSRLSSLATHMNAQMHLSFSGIDYYGSDVGGFHRHSADGDINEIYTQWLANAAWFDVPVRPHTMNLGNTYRTSPHEIGHTPSNLANLRQRYELIPYYYSLARAAHELGEPVVAPLVYYFQGDDQVRPMGHQKMVGPSLLVGIVARNGERERDIYLPRGDWINYHTHEVYSSSGEWIRSVQVYLDGLFKLPVFVKAGAVIPFMRIGEVSVDAFGRSNTQMDHDTLSVRIFPSRNQTSFTAYEDDGKTTAYLAGQFAKTTVTQQVTSPGTISVSIGAREGEFQTEAPSSRKLWLELHTAGSAVEEVLLNGEVLRRSDDEAREVSDGGDAWFAERGQFVVISANQISSDNSTAVSVRLR